MIFKILFFLFSILSIGMGDYHMTEIWEGSVLRPGTVDVDPALMDPSFIWYTPILSAYELYRNVEGLLNVPWTQLTEDDVAHSCLACKIPGDVICTGVGDGLFTIYNTSESTDAIFRHVTSSGKIGTSYTTLTDNHSYFVMINFWDNQNIAWNVFSLWPTISDQVRNEVLEHVKTFGFDMSKTREVDYTGCHYNFNKK